MKPKTRLLVLLVSTPTLAFAIVGGFLGKASAGEETYQHLRVFEDVVSLVLNNYVEAVNLDRVMEGAMQGLAEGLDADSAYLSADEVRAVEKNAPLPEAGVGLELTRQYYLRVIAARDASPAAKAGLRPGDYIRAIDGKPTRDMTVFRGTRLLRGAPGSTVSLLVIRGNAAEPHSLDLVREKPNGAAVSGRIAAAGVGLLRIAAFTPDAASQIPARVGELTKGGATRLAIDVRNTAEGSVEAGLAAAHLFVGSGTLAGLEGRGDAKKTFDAAAGDGSITLPAALMINAGTSGPAEIFVAALAGNKRAEAIGERTLGRAGVQKLIRLPDGSGLMMTWARYLTPAGAAIHGKGIVPATQVDEPDVEIGAAPPSTDPILDKTLEILAAKPAAP